MENMQDAYSTSEHNKHLSYNSDIKSTRSEDKHTRGKKQPHSMHPTSETLSFKDSSATSGRDNKLMNSDQKMKKDKDLNTGKWVTSEKKAKKPKGKQKNKKPLKSDRPMYTQPDPIDKSRSTCNNSPTPPDSIWSQEIAQEIFSNPAPKKKTQRSNKSQNNQHPGEKKDLKKGKGSKTDRKSENKPELKPKKKSNSKKEQGAKLHKKSKEFKEIGIEEKKIDLSVKPDIKPKSFSASKPKLESESFREEKKGQRDKNMLPPKPHRDHRNDRKYGNKRFNFDEEVQKHNIPHETVSSFYQIDEGYVSNPKFHKSQSQKYHSNYEVTPQYDNQEYNTGYMDYEQEQYSNPNSGFGYSDVSANMYSQGYNNMHPDSSAGYGHNTEKQFQCESLLYKKLSTEIQEMADHLTKMVNLTKPYCMALKAQLEQVAISTFTPSHSNVQAHIYGSVATNLALPESDMDLVVTGVSCFGSKEQHTENITELFGKIQARFSDKLMVKSQLILQTQVPIIKLSFSLEKYYEDQQGENLPFVDWENVDPNLRELAVDVSIADGFESEHQGIKAAGFVEQCLIQYPILRPVCLILKKLLVKYGFNNPYTGGLGSFSLFLMLYAAYFIEKINTYESFHEESTHPARLFAWFLTYFGEYFDIAHMAIMFMQEAMPLTILKAYCGIDIKEYDPDRKML